MSSRKALVLDKSEQEPLATMHEAFVDKAYCHCASVDSQQRKNTFPQKSKPLPQSHFRSTGEAPRTTPVSSKSRHCHRVGVHHGHPRHTPHCGEHELGEGGSLKICIGLRHEDDAHCKKRVAFVCEQDSDFRLFAPAPNSETR